MKIFLKFSLVLGLLCAASSGKILSYEQIKDEPKSLAKDYYIYRLIDETKYNKAEIKILKQSIFRYKGKLKDKLDRIFGVAKAPKRPDRCAGVTSANILDANLTCKKARSYPNFIAKLSPSVRETLASQLEKHQDAASRNAVNLLRGFNDENPSEYFMQSRNAQNYFLYYDYLKGADKDALIDIDADAAFVSELASQKGFKAVLNDALINRKYPHLRRSLTGVDPLAVEKDIAFMLGVNAVMQGDEGAALAFFNRAAASFEKPHDVHNAKFWIYLLNGDQNVLRQLASSDYYSLYALYAKEILGNKNLNIIIPNPAKNSIEGYDITDPFAWVRTKNSADRMSRPQLLEFAKKFDTKQSIGEYSYIMNKASGGKDNFYPTPFMEYIGDGDNRRKALILALARQESRFVPASVSTSYALGMMQFMPFLANEIGKKQLKIDGFDQDDMFRPEVAYRFANIHIDWLERKIYSPVFIAYAYNGGLGLVKKMLQRGDMFNKGKFEPWLSMELVPYAESRDYGKKVLANFIIYSQILDPRAKVSVQQELQDLLIPSRSDDFR